MASDAAAKGRQLALFFSHPPAPAGICYTLGQHCSRPPSARASLGPGLLGLFLARSPHSMSQRVTKPSFVRPKDQRGGSAQRSSLQSQPTGARPTYSLRGAPLPLLAPPRYLILLHTCDRFCGGVKGPRSCELRRGQTDRGSLVATGSSSQVDRRARCPRDKQGLVGS